MSDNNITYIKFNLDPIDDPKYGTATNLNGKLQFVLPPGEYKFPKLLREPERLKKVVTGFVPDCRDIWPDLLDDEIYSRVKDFAQWTALLNPTDLEHPNMQTITLYCCMGFTFDDLLDMLSTSGSTQNKDTQVNSLFTYKGFSQQCQKAMESANGESFFDNFPSVHPSVDSIKKFGMKILNKARKCVEDFDNKQYKTSGLAQEIHNSFLASIAVDELFKEGKKMYSTTSMFELYRYISAVRLALELSGIFHDIQISPQIRSDILFQTVVNNYSDITTFYNSILGLPRDVKLTQEDGPIMYLVSVRKMGLQEAFDNVCERLNGAYNDFRINTAKLCEVYSDDENIPKFCKLMGNIIDGTLYGYKVGGRYGVQDKLHIPGFDKL